MKRADLHPVGPVGVSSNIRRTADNANELEVEHNTSQIFVDETDGPVGLILGECALAILAVCLRPNPFEGFGIYLSFAKFKVCKLIN